MRNCGAGETTCNLQAVLLSLRGKVLRQHSQIPWVRLKAELKIINELVLSQVTKIQWDQHFESLKGRGRVEQVEYRRELDWVIQ